MREKFAMVKVSISRFSSSRIPRELNFYQRNWAYSHTLGTTATDVKN